MPLPRRRNWWPLWVPAGMLMRAILPSSVGTSMVPPSVAVHHRDRHPAMDVGAVALEQLVAAHRQEDVEIARRPAAHAGLALAGEADARAVLDARPGC